MKGACTSSMYQRGGLDQAAFRTRAPAGGSVHAFFGACAVSLLLILIWVLAAGMQHRVLRVIKCLNGHLLGDAASKFQGFPARKKTAKRTQAPRKKKRASLAKNHPEALGEAAPGEGKTPVPACTGDAAETDGDDDLEDYEVIHRSETADGEDSRSD